MEPAVCNAPGACLSGASSAVLARNPAYPIINSRNKRLCACVGIDRVKYMLIHLLGAVLVNPGSEHGAQRSGKQQRTSAT